MKNEISHITVSSVYPVAFWLGAITGILVSLPMLVHWIETAQWITGVEMGVGLFTLGLFLSIVTTAIVTGIVVIVYVIGYNLVAGRYGGIELQLRS